MRRFVGFYLVVSMLAGTPATSGAADGPNPAYTDPDRTDDDFAFQGEYVGEITHDGQPLRFGVQIIALGDGRFDAVAYPGGVTRRGEIRAVDGGHALVVLDADGGEIAKLPRVARTSPTLGEPPPPGAIVIFDGAGPTDEAATLVAARITDDGLLQEGVTTKGEFGDAHWHIEFRLPYQPRDRGQGRGNSGAYLQGRYEVQMLDSFGLAGKNNECGGVYSVAAPRVNMCLPPLAWQTYDIDFTAPRFDGDRKVADARMTVRHNGVLIHEDVAVPKITPGGPQKQEQPTGPLHLQNHGNPVRYRNVWVQPKS